MQLNRTLTLTLSLSQRERATLGGTVSSSPNSDSKRVLSCSPLPARSGERIKVRGTSNCIITAKELDRSYEFSAAKLGASSTARIAAVPSLHDGEVGRGDFKRA